MFAAKNEERVQAQLKSSNVSMSINTSKVNAAKKILKSFGDSKDNCKALLEQATQLIDAYIELADHRQECEQGVNYPITNLLKRLKWSPKTSLVAVPTYSGNCEGTDAPKVASFNGWSYPGIRRSCIEVDQSLLTHYDMSPWGIFRYRRNHEAKKNYLLLH